MADVTIKYNGSAVAELNGTGNKTLKTSGKYCEGNVEVAYAPRSKTYEITLVKASGWVLLTTLDEEVLEHINDPGLVVSLKMVSDYEYTYYAGNAFIVGNSILGYYNTYETYGISTRTNKETSISANAVFYPANKTDTSTSLGGTCMFRLNGNNYYIRPGDGYVYPGTYRLTFTW